MPEPCPMATRSKMGKSRDFLNRTEGMSAAHLWLAYPTPTSPDLPRNLPSWPIVPFRYQPMIVRLSDPLKRWCADPLLRCSVLDSPSFRRVHGTCHVDTIVLPSWHDRFLQIPNLPRWTDRKQSSPNKCQNPAQWPLGPKWASQETS